MSATPPPVLQAPDPDHDAGRPRPQFMVVPSLACPAHCGYCFGLHQGPIMSPEVADAAVAFIARIAVETGMARVRVTFYGGEPLMAGPDLFRRILTGLGERLGADRLRPLAGGDARHTLPPDDYGRPLCDLADHYIAHRREVAIASLDQVCQSLGTGQGQTCTFRDCLGMFIAIDPRGDPSARVAARRHVLLAPRRSACTLSV
jgi:sulfatase maturation enzyme AslB (radical SAM superfamily)